MTSFEIVYTRKKYIWIEWELTVYFDGKGGHDYTTSKGGNLTRKRAHAAATTWLRVLLRQRGFNPYLVGR